MISSFPVICSKKKKGCLVFFFLLRRCFAVISRCMFTSLLCLNWERVTIKANKRKRKRNTPLKRDFKKARKVVITSIDFSALFRGLVFLVLFFFFFFGLDLDLVLVFMSSLAFLRSLHSSSLCLTYICVYTSTTYRSIIVLSKNIYIISIFLFLSYLSRMSSWTSATHIFTYISTIILLLYIISTLFFQWVPS